MSDKSYTTPKQKEGKETVSLRMPISVLSAIDSMAAKQERSRTWIIVNLLKGAI